MKLNLKPGQKLCRTCLKRTMSSNGAQSIVAKDVSRHTSKPECELETIHEEQEEVEENDMEYVPATFSLNNINKTAEVLDCTPMRLVRDRDKAGYCKKKIQKLHKALSETCANALDLKTDDLKSEENNSSHSDLDRFVDLLKAKIQISPRQEKIKLLTLAPESWTKKKTQEVFGVSDRMVKRARQLKRDKGILASPDHKRGKTVNGDVKQRIHDFYQSDEYSRMCPGKKEYITVRDGTIKEQKQKRLLLANLRELYLEYKHKNPSDKVGFSTFCELRPKWCIPVTAPGMHSVCVCEHHQNVKLLTAAIPGKQDYKNILSKLVCSLENRTCMLHLCELCPGKIVVQDYLAEVFNSHDFDDEDIVTYKQWVHTNRTTLVTLSTSVQEFIQVACDAFDNLRQHHFVAKAQASYLSKLKDDISHDEAVVLLDFAENYSFLIQDAVQGHHWDNAQATLHPFVVYYHK